MKPNKRDLKAYVRYDGSGKIVPSSVMLARKIPKVGEWMEIDAYECCQPVPIIHTSICVAGFVENSEFNGTYTYINLTEGKSHYQKDAGLYNVYWDGSKWVIGEVAYSVDDVDEPTSVILWISSPLDGDITVVAGICTTTTTTTVASTTTTTTERGGTTTTTTTEPIYHYSVQTYIAVEAICTADQIIEVSSTVPAVIGKFYDFVDDGHNDIIIEVLSTSPTGGDDYTETFEGVYRDTCFV